MGNPIIQLKPEMRVTILTALILTITYSVVVFFPCVENLFSTYHIAYSKYEPLTEVISEVDISKLPPAQAVPILMYHGVIAEKDDSNTTIINFREVMEMLKREGYSTISVAEFDLFRSGQFVLPPKPIIITFDDGRKDSYYTTDDVLRQLGFKATLFEATGPHLNGNTFYLTFEELRAMRDTGRWEIEPHGRHSHEYVQISDDQNDGTYGRYLTSKVYLPDFGRLETEEEFEQRVEQDYVDGIEDLKNNIGVDARYFAIPLNDYGELPVSNYPKAAAFNKLLLEKYFRLAFIQANESDDVLKFNLPIYNFKNDDPYVMRRIEMKNMNADQLKELLEMEAPVASVLDVLGLGFQEQDFNRAYSTGAIHYYDNGAFVEAEQIAKNAQIIFGENYWNDYEVDVVLSKSVGRSAAVLVYFRDPKNYISFGQTDRGYFLRQTIDGVTEDLQMSYIPETIESGTTRFKVRIKEGRLTASVNGFIVYSKIPVSIDRGGLGVRFWDDKLKAAGMILSLKVKPI